MNKNSSNYSRLGGLEPFEDKRPYVSDRVLLASLYPMMCMLAILKIAPDVVELIDDYSDFLDSRERKNQLCSAVRHRRGQS